MIKVDLACAIPGAGLAAGAAGTFKRFRNAAKSVDLTALRRLTQNNSEIRMLNLSLASESQMLSRGVPIFIGDEIREIDGIINNFGGNIPDWAKMSSHSYKFDNIQIETHWYENLVTGQKIKYKTKLNWSK